MWSARREDDGGRVEAAAAACRWREGPVRRPGQGGPRGHRPGSSTGRRPGAAPGGGLDRPVRGGGLRDPVPVRAHAPARVRAAGGSRPGAGRARPVVGSPHSRGHARAATGRGTGDGTASRLRPGLVAGLAPAAQGGRTGGGGAQSGTEDDRQLASALPRAGPARLGGPPADPQTPGVRVGGSGRRHRDAAGDQRGRRRLDPDRLLPDLAHRGDPAAAAGRGARP